MVEHKTENLGVGGSIPPHSTNFYNPCNLRVTRIVKTKQSKFQINETNLKQLAPKPCKQPLFIENIEQIRMIALDKKIATHLSYDNLS